MRIASWALAAFLCVGTTASMAADGSSGCGPGWYIFKQNSLLSSFARTITNGLLFPAVTIGMTFGTSNCSRHSLVFHDQESLQFAAKSFEILRQDIAKGQGEHLNAYLASFGCHELARPELASALQQAFKDNLYKSQSPVDYVESTRILIDFSSRSRMCS